MLSDSNLKFQAVNPKHNVTNLYEIQISKAWKKNETGGKPVTLQRGPIKPTGKTWTMNSAFLPSILNSKAKAVIIKTRMNLQALGYQTLPSTLPIRLWIVK